MQPRRVLRQVEVRVAATAGEVRHRRHVRTRKNFDDLTMVSAEAMVENLRLVRQWRSTPGDIVECGVWRGGMSGAMAMTAPGHHHVLFDSFEGLPEAQAIDGEAALRWQRDIREYDNCTAEERWAHDAMRRAGTSDYEVVKGWFDDTVPKWATQERPIAMLRLDGDWYESTRVCLDHLMPLVVSGGLVIIDDYATWDGCARAVHDHLSRTASTARIKCTPGGVTYLGIP